MPLFHYSTIPLFHYSTIPAPHSEAPSGISLGVISCHYLSLAGFAEMSVLDLLAAVLSGITEH